LGSPVMRKRLLVTVLAGTIVLVAGGLAWGASRTPSTSAAKQAGQCLGPTARSTYKSTNPKPLGAAAGLAEAKRLLKIQEGTKTAPPPSLRVPAIKSKGKTVFVIPVLGTIPVAQITNNALKEALALAGAKTIAIDGQGQVSVWTRGIQEAISRKVDGLALEAISTKVVQAPVESAHAAGIKIVQGFEWDAGCPGLLEQKAGVSAQVTYSYVEMGKRLADFTIADSNGKANAVFIGSSDVFTSALVYGAAKDEFTRLCPGCKLTLVDSPQTQPPSRLDTLTRTLVQKDPTINYMLPVFDAMALHMVPALHAAGAADRVKIATTNGTPAALALVKNGDVIAADVGANIAWSGWGIADEFFRVFAGQKTIADERVPTRTFDANNIDQINLKADQSTWFGAPTWKQQYKKTWGLR
jgi:ribose transport system substrate-binding protein